MTETQRTVNTKVASTCGRWHSVTAGIVAGCVTRTTTSPLDVVKILVQVSSQGGSVQSTCRTLYKSNGIRGFWKGNLAGCCRLGPYSGIKFCLFDQLQATRDPTSTPSSIERAVCGATAGLFATFTVYPIELMRTRLIVAKNPPTMVQECVSILRAEGIRGLYRGCLSGLVGAIPFEGIQFASYEYGKSFVTEYRWPASRWPTDKTKLDTVDHLVLGSLSGAVAQMVAYPFDTIKKRLQLQAADTPVKNGMKQCFDQILRTEGIRGLYRGSAANMVRLVPYAAVMFASYETTKEVLQSL
ncbi:Aste57867_16528 [Aphanomyces stellatus]|uniref:Aste57867_16528 protein n=1 Tax=Aphanomyces stellatus TaxID=120398 RepID=A0A485L8T6_9STRA|nr:hypothetical protein As57867_016471 [Aphanomyces stellatus]VFT93302.1 Aste57867_16528 [Aphanomyces stellatus]